MSFTERPVLAFWEMTRACPLACAHCRASAIPARSPEELTTAQGRGLLENLTRFGPPYPTVILTGGDPLMRPDLFELIAHARALGLRVAVSPAVSERLTDEVLGRLRDLGVAAVSVSLDGATAATHDAFRGAAGTFDRTMATIRAGLAVGLRLQVNSTVTASNLTELPALFDRIVAAGVRTWEVFFLIATGRGSAVRSPTAEESEAVGQFLFDASRYGALIRPVEAPFVRRILRERGEGVPPRGGELYRRLADDLERRLGPPTSASSLAPRGTLDGDGILFVGHDGTVFPGGFLPTALGNVRTDDLVAVYRNAPLLRAIRGRELAGVCRDCVDREACGGSRARAFAAVGDPLASDPGCWLAARTPAWAG